MHSFCLRILALVSSFTGLAHCVTVTIPNPIINVTAGNSVTLSCAYTLATSNTHNLLIQWNFFEAHSQLLVPVYFYQNGQSYPTGRFKNRVTGYNSTGNASITISNMQPQDTGFYICEVSNLPDLLGTGHMQVIVQAPPSTPHCSIDGNMAVGHSVTLVCFSKLGMPQPVYTWNKVVNGVLMPVNAEQSAGVLVIGNMTKFEDGYYRCTSSNNLGNATCELDLHTGGEAGIVVAGIIGAMLLATIICVVIWFLVAKKKNKAKQSATEMKTTSAAGNTAQAEPEAQAKQNLVVTETPEVREYSDQPEYATADETEDPAV
ncbi:V-set and immunoglobulin domain-containing protein 1 isoform X1 [Pyxicephalus adspersus]|uniref:V-set and immunoglobulin domain-containing protein 1 isoform X1 n=1 Tax=Pyxicephalus adspersus TaxID=30357 RepID=UPI003B5CFE29